MYHWYVHFYYLLVDYQLIFRFHMNSWLFFVVKYICDMTSKITWNDTQNKFHVMCARAEREQEHQRSIHFEMCWVNTITLHITVYFLFHLKWHFVVSVYLSSEEIMEQNKKKTSSTSQHYDCTEMTWESGVYDLHLAHYHFFSFHRIYMYVVQSVDIILRYHI